MTLTDDNVRFVEAACEHGLLTQAIAREVLANSGSADLASTLVLQRGLMDVRQVDMIQILVRGREVIPGYTIVGIIGYGGMGVVFRAKQEALGREVALKTIRIGSRIDESIRRFRKEVLSIARLNHPNIVTAYDSGEHDGRIYLAMELVEGQNVTEYVLECGPLTAIEALSITRQSAIGLAHAWGNGIVHRDIKPDNLLLTRPSEFEKERTVKIADLGLAVLNSDTEETRITQTGAAVGTPLYMSPEQLNGGTVDARSDIYSLGCTLYFMLSGRPPFTGDSVAAVMFNKAAGQSIPLSEVAEVDPQLLQLVESMMANDRGSRPSDYQSLVAEIDRISGTHRVGRETPSAVASGRPVTNVQRLDARADTLMISSEPTAANPERSQVRRGVSAGLQGVAAGILVAGLIWYGLLWNRPDSAAVLDESLVSTWSEPLFDGSSLEGWDQWTSGVLWEVTTEPIEQAFALSGQTKPNADGTTRRRIPVRAESPHFEIRFATVLDKGAAAGVLFGATESSRSSSGYLLRIDESTVVLSRVDSGDVIGRATLSKARNSEMHHVLVRLQPNGWFVRVDETISLSAPVAGRMLPEIRLYVENGRAYFTDLTASGLQARSE